jgi:uroporphyrinogen decarboxylase
LTPRQRRIETLTFGRPDKVPFAPGGPRESTLKRWHAEGLPDDGTPWDHHLMAALGIVRQPTGRRVDLGASFLMIPQFEEKVLEHADGHYVVQDWKGNICEISDAYDVTYLRYPKDFVTRRWIRCPVQTRDDWEHMKTRYAVDAPGRFADDFADRCRRARDRDWTLEIRFPGPFWQMREWCGFEGLCLMMIERPAFVDEMAAFWCEFVAAVLARIVEQVSPDAIHFSEDMAYKAKAMISPAMTGRFCQPSWVRWSRQAAAAGIPLVGLDSDGYIGELIPIWIASGVNYCDPIEVAAHNDLNAYRATFGRRMAYVGGVDKRAIARGGRAIRDELRRIEPVVRDGGYVPSCDHGVPSDVSWPNFLDYARRLAEITGWL